MSVFKSLERRTRENPYRININQLCPDGDLQPRPLSSKKDEGRPSGLPGTAWTVLSMPGASEAPSPQQTRGLDQQGWGYNLQERLLSGRAGLGGRLDLAQRAAVWS